MLISLKELQTLVKEGQENKQKEHLAEIARVKEYVQSDAVTERTNDLLKKAASDGRTSFTTHTSFFYSSEIYKDIDYKVLYTAAKEYLESNGFSVDPPSNTAGLTDFSHMTISW